MYIIESLIENWFNPNKLLSLNKAIIIIIIIIIKVEFNALKLNSTR